MSQIQQRYINYAQTANTNPYAPYIGYDNAKQEVPWEGQKAQAVEHSHYPSYAPSNLSNQIYPNATNRAPYNTQINKEQPAIYTMSNPQNSYIPSNYYTIEENANYEQPYAENRLKYMMGLNDKQRNMYQEVSSFRDDYSNPTQRANDFYNSHENRLLASHYIKPEGYTLSSMQPTNKYNGEQNENYNSLNIENSLSNQSMPQRSIKYNPLIDAKQYYSPAPQNANQIGETPQQMISKHQIIHNIQNIAEQDEQNQKYNENITGIGRRSQIIQSYQDSVTKATKFKSGLDEQIEYKKNMKELEKKKQKEQDSKEEQRIKREQQELEEQYRKEQETKKKKAYQIINDNAQIMGQRTKKANKHIIDLPYIEQNKSSDTLTKNSHSIIVQSRGAPQTHEHTLLKKEMHIMKEQMHKNSEDFRQEMDQIKDDLLQTIIQKQKIQQDLDNIRMEVKHKHTEEQDESSLVIFNSISRSREQSRVGTKLASRDTSDYIPSATKNKVTRRKANDSIPMVKTHEMQQQNIHNSPDKVAKYIVTGKKTQSSKYELQTNDYKDDQPTSTINGNVDYIDSVSKVNMQRLADLDIEQSNPLDESDDMAQLDKLVNNIVKKRRDDIGPLPVKGELEILTTEEGKRDSEANENINVEDFLKQDINKFE